MLQKFLDDQAFNLVPRVKKIILDCEDPSTRAQMRFFTIRCFLNSFKSFDDMTHKEQHAFEHGIIHGFTHKRWV